MIIVREGSTALEYWCIRKEVLLLRPIMTPKADQQDIRQSETMRLVVSFLSIDMNHQWSIELKRKIVAFHRQIVQLYPRPSDIIGPTSAPGTIKRYTQRDSKPAISNYTPLTEADVMEAIPAIILEELRDRFLHGFSEGDFGISTELHLSYLEILNASLLFVWTGSRMLFKDHIPSPIVKDFLKWKFKLTYFPGSSHLTDSYGEEAARVWWNQYMVNTIWQT